MRRCLFIVGLLLTFAFASDYVVYAQSNTLTPTKSPRELRANFREEEKETLEELKEEIDTRREAVKNQIKTRRDELRLKIDEFKDKRKAQIAERVTENLNKVNENRVNAMTRHVEQMEKLLLKLKERVAKAKAEGKDTTATDSKISSAESAIANAKTALMSQASKDYTLSSTTESNVKSDLQAKRKLLSSDLKSVHEKLVLARKSLSEAVSSLNLGRRETKETTTPTTTQNVTPTIGGSN